MKEVIAHYNAGKKSGLTTCAAVRATTQQFIDVPRSEMQRILVGECKVNSSTARTQIQLGRKSLGIVDVPAPKPAPAAVPAKAAKAVQKKAGASK